MSVRALVSETVCRGLSLLTGELDGEILQVRSSDAIAYACSVPVDAINLIVEDADVLFWAKEYDCSNMLTLMSMLGSVPAGVSPRRLYPAFVMSTASALSAALTAVALKPWVVTSGW